jgi:hypothetical protein
MFILSINFDFDDECQHHRPQYHGFLEAVAVLLRSSKKITSLMLDIRFLGFSSGKFGSRLCWL